MTGGASGESQSTIGPTELARIERAAPIRRLEFHEEIGSTNDRTKQLAVDARGDYPLLVLAGRQTAGRGRGGNRWWSGEGALTFSLVFDAAAVSLPSEHRPAVSLVAALAVCEAIEPHVLQTPPRIKWPNDVYVADRKACGILVESVAGKLIIGVGLNVNNSLFDAPAELRNKAIALCDLLGRSLDWSEVAIAVVARLVRRIEEFPGAPAALFAAWRSRCLLTGKQVRLVDSGRTAAGLCRGIDDAGALLIETPQGLVRCFSGVVEEF